MKTIAVFLITLYQLFFSQLLRAITGTPVACRYAQPCSEYTKEAIVRLGLMKGLLVGGRRILSCNPF